MSMRNSLVATYASPHLAEIDIDKLQNAGIDMSTLRIVSHKPYDKAVQRGLAPVLRSFGELDTELYDCIPERDIVDFEAALSTGRMFIVAHAATEEIDRARLIAGSTHNTSWDGLADCEIYYGCMD